MAFPKLKKKQQAAPGAAGQAPVPPQPAGYMRPQPAGLEALARKVSRFQIAVAVLAAVCVACIGAAAATKASSDALIAQTFNGTTEVVVLTQSVAQGQQVTADALGTAKVPNSQLVEGAITVEALNSGDAKIEGAAAQYLPRGTQLSSASLSTQGNPASLAASLEEGMEAVSVSVDAQTGVSGMLRAGDTVRVLTPLPDELGGEGVSTVVESAKVAAIGTDFSDGASGDYSCVTLALSPDDADAVKAALAKDGVTLTLISSADAGE